MDNPQFIDEFPIKLHYFYWISHPAMLPEGSRGGTSWNLRFLTHRRYVSWLRRNAAPVMSRERGGRSSSRGKLPFGGYTNWYASFSDLKHIACKIWNTNIRSKNWMEKCFISMHLFGHFLCFLPALVGCLWPWASLAVPMDVWMWAPTV